MKATYFLAIPLTAGLAFGQSKTAWIGTLVDANCQSTRTERTESRDANGQRSVTTTTQTTQNLDCPVTSASTTFGIVTSDGRFVRFDNPSNTRVIEIVRGDQGFSRSAADRTPIRVRVLGTANGDLAVVETLTSDASQSAGADRLADAPDAIYDVRYKGDRGKLVIGSKAISLENLSDAKESRSWTYAQIKELKRDGNELEIVPYTGDDEEFRVEGAGMTDVVYKSIGDRIAASRAR